MAYSARILLGGRKIFRPIFANMEGSLGLTFKY